MKECGRKQPFGGVQILKKLADEEDCEIGQKAINRDVEGDS